MEKKSAKSAGYIGAAATILGGSGSYSMYSNWLNKGGALSGITDSGENVGTYNYDIYGNPA
jgi:hypothetical protein